MIRRSLISPHHRGTLSHASAAHVYSAGLTSFSDLLRERRLLATVTALLPLLRLPIAAAVAFLITVGNLTSVAALIAVAIALDILDGELFSIFPESRDKSLFRFRRVLDSHCDRILILSTILPLALHTGFSHTFFWLFATRELILGFQYAVPFYAHGRVFGPNAASKAATFTMGLVAILFCLGQQPRAEWAALFTSLSLAGIVIHHRCPRLI